MHSCKKFSLLLLCFAVIFTSFAVYIPTQQAEARTLKQVEADLKDCEKLLASLQNQKASISSEINKIGNQKNVTKNQLNLYIKEIDSLEAEIALTEETVESYVMKISDIEAEIIIQEENLAYYNTMYDHIVRYSFKQGEISIFQLLFEAENFSDFLTRVDDINYFLNYTDSVMESIKTVKNDLETIKETHSSSKHKLDEHKTNLEAKKATIAHKKAEFEQRASSLGTNLAKEQSKYSSTSSLIQQTRTKIAALKKERESLLNVGKNFRWPLNISGRISSPFGPRRNPFSGSNWEFHNGLDIACGYGTPIVASKGGTVTKSRWSGGYGNCVVIYHGNGVSTLYAHASKLLVKEGAHVKQGQVLAKVGSTGRSSGNHLHFGVLVNGSPKDPQKYLPKR